GVAQWLRQRLTAKQYPFDRAGMEPYLEAARAALGETEWQRYVLSGELMPLEGAVNYALHADHPET
ncbi:MAG TPA: hypothetical protein VF660_00155, partial [Actinomycetota bacterium]